MSVQMLRLDKDIAVITKHEKNLTWKKWMTHNMKINFQKTKLYSE